MIRLTISLIIYRWVSTHITDEQDHCALAIACAHDGVAVYGVAPDNRTARLFYDLCDVHEYNCDHQTSYKACVEPPVTASQKTDADLNLPFLGTTKALLKRTVSKLPRKNKIINQAHTVKRKLENQFKKNKAVTGRIVLTKRPKKKRKTRKNSSTLLQRPGRMTLPGK